MVSNPGDQVPPPTSAANNAKGDRLLAPDVRSPAQARWPVSTLVSRLREGNGSGIIARRSKGQGFLQHAPRPKGDV